ncbi:hypothetical protein FSARC_7175 [Fusarium sarcochroum]|uniref:Uncharacterized protein n=1 Tax=Fusarium sarcochroum TaxID=1208366 RepID=A0A8H4TVK0_9HYPO|nr:hypothetical protein FSARC_7175 [Fusarium sarcochroum]
MTAVSSDDTDKKSSPATAHKVAVIGAGISGVTATAHFVRYGLDVVLFERSAAAGGVWHFDPIPSLEPNYPNDRAKLLDDEILRANWGNQSEIVFAADRNDIPVLYAPPGPCYEKLTTNIPTTIMRSSLLSWPEGTPEHFDHLAVEKYICNIAESNGVANVTRFNTRVEDVAKLPGSDFWQVRSSTLRQKDDGSYAIQRNDETFDTVVVATGHYQEPHIPDIMGLSEWKSRFPERILHSKRFRSPRPFKNQNVLLIGAGVSSVDIAQHLDGHANKIYRSSRGGQFDINASYFPALTQAVAEVQSMEFDSQATPDGPLSHDQPIPGRVVFKDGTVLEDIHAVIVATGYLTTYPFLKGLQSDTMDRENADENIVITSDASMVHNLHKDIFYMPDPTLAFVGVPFHCSTFSLFDFQGEVIARVFTGVANLPSKETMREEYKGRKASRGLGRLFHSLLHDEVTYMDGILDWVNSEAKKRGLEPMPGVDAEWKVSYKKFKEVAIGGLETGGEKL